MTEIAAPVRCCAAQSPKMLCGGPPYLTAGTKYGVTCRTRRGSMRSAAVQLGRIEAACGSFLLAHERHQTQPIEHDDRNAEVYEDAERDAEHRRPRSLEQIQRQPERNRGERNEQLAVPYQ